MARRLRHIFRCLRAVSNPRVYTPAKYGETARVIKVIKLAIAK